MYFSYLLTFLLAVGLALFLIGRMKASMDMDIDMVADSLKNVIGCENLADFKHNNNDFSIELVKPDNIKIIRYTNYFSSFAIYEEQIDQVSESAHIILKGKARCIAYEGLNTKLLEFLKCNSRFSDLMTRLWSNIAQYGNMLHVTGLRINPDDLKKEDIDTTLAFLGTFSKSLSPDWSGGTITVRYGFENKPFVWNWDNQMLMHASKLGLQKLSISYYMEMPYINPVLISIFSSFSEQNEIFWVFKKKTETSIVKKQFDFGFKSGVVYNWTNDLLCCLDWTNEGALLAAVIPKSGFKKEVEQLIHKTEDYNMVMELIKNMDKIELLMRRLLDWEASWYSGEYELLSQNDFIKTAKDKITEVAQQYNATATEINQTFNIKILTNEKFVRGY